MVHHHAKFSSSSNGWSGVNTGSALAAASDIHRQVPTNMAGIRHDWLTNQNTDQCFVVIGLSTRQSHSALQQLKIDHVRQLGLPYWLAPSWCQRIFINIRGQYGIKKNIYIHPWFRLRRRTVKCSGENVADRPPPRLITSDPPTSSSWQHQHSNWTHTESLLNHATSRRHANKQSTRGWTW